MNSDEEDEQIRQDQDILDESDLEKPEKPVSTFGPEAREKIVEKFHEIRRLPGEPVITPELCNDAGVTPANQCPRLVSVYYMCLREYTFVTSCFIFQG